MPKPKLRRRGDRLIITKGEERKVFILFKDNLRRMIEVTRPHEHFYVTYDPLSKYAMMKGESHGKPIDIVHQTSDREFIAARPGADHSWRFADPDDDEGWLISVEDVPMENRALVAAKVCLKMDDDLAKFLDVHPMVCRVNDIKAIYDDPRYAPIRQFRFEVKPFAHDDLGTTRRAENIIRHQFTNYDEMIKEAGGLLHPDVYENIRLGVDTLVKSHMAIAARGK